MRREFTGKFEDTVCGEFFRQSTVAKHATKMLRNAINPDGFLDKFAKIPPHIPLQSTARVQARQTFFARRVMSGALALAGGSVSICSQGSRQWLLDIPSCSNMLFQKALDIACRKSS